jgi:ABC-type uncharacterized transport system ATPase subunit
MRGISKRFGAVQANRGVDLEVRRGSVHGIVGENGAGKSTLMAILYGLVPADAGEIEVDGRALRIAGSRDAIRAGIGMVHQHFMLVDRLSGLDNVILGAEPGWRLRPARAQARARLCALMADTGLQVRLDLAVEQLPVGERQRLEILKALYRGARILILDEPTAMLTPHETAQLFDTLRRLRAGGTTVLLISHKLAEIVALCDAVTVMRAGAVVLDRAVSDTGIDALAEAMVGRRVGNGAGAPAPAAAAGAPLLQARDLHCDDALGVTRLAGVALELHRGEIVGVAGVAGNGQSELLEVLAGMRSPRAGALAVGEQRFEPSRWIDPVAARALGIAHLPEDRQRCGLILAFAAWESAVLGYHRAARYRAPWAGLDRAAMRADAAALMAEFDVRPPDPDLRTGQLSGGNQQKLMVAREAGAAPQVLLAGQPTRGVDIGAVETIHRQLRAIRERGGAVLLVSSDLDEILALADRVLVLDRGRIRGELPRARCDTVALGRLMAAAAA